MKPQGHAVIKMGCGQWPGRDIFGIQDQQVALADAGAIDECQQVP